MSLKKLTARTAKQMFKFGINLIMVDREQHLNKAVGTQITSLLEVLDENLFVDLFNYFDNLWKTHFSVNFSNNKKNNQPKLFDFIRTHNYQSMMQHKRTINMTVSDNDCVFKSSKKPKINNDSNTSDQPSTWLGWW
jgi:hypothetical protein